MRLTDCGEEEMEGGKRGNRTCSRDSKRERLGGQRDGDVTRSRGLRPRPDCCLLLPAHPKRGAWAWLPAPCLARRGKHCLFSTPAQSGAAGFPAGELR